MQRPALTESKSVRWEGTSQASMPMAWSSKAGERCASSSHVVRPPSACPDAPTRRRPKAASAKKVRSSSAVLETAPTGVGHWRGWRDGGP